MSTPSPIQDVIKTENEAPASDEVVMLASKSCGDCGAAFPTARNLERHRRSVHFKIKEFVCGQCGRAFSAKADLKRHERNKHAEVGVSGGWWV